MLKLTGMGEKSIWLGQWAVLIPQTHIVRATLVWSRVFDTWSVPESLTMVDQDGVSEGVRGWSVWYGKGEKG